jgi:hypothetical protein
MRPCYICGGNTDNWYEDTCETCKEEITHVYLPNPKQELEQVERILWNDKEYKINS